MHLDYDSFTSAVVRTLNDSGDWHRAVCIDLETKVDAEHGFLSGERLLGIGLARRAEGKVETATLRLEKETDEAEMELMNSAARWLAPIKPLMLIGYNISGYDFPLLALKLKWYDGLMRAKAGKEKAAFPKEYWALKDALTRAYILDMMHPLRYFVAEKDKSTPKYRSLAFMVAHPAFSHVALMRLKHLAEAETSEDKGKRIYGMWKEKNPDFERYLKADVHDVLLLAEEMYCKKD